MATDLQIVVQWAKSNSAPSEVYNAACRLLAEAECPTPPDDTAATPSHANNHASSHASEHVGPPDGVEGLREQATEAAKDAFCGGDKSQDGTRRLSDLRNPWRALDDALAAQWAVVSPVLERLRAERDAYRLARNGATAMMGVHKARADRLRHELDHAKAALTGDSEGIRLFMADHEQRVERLKEQARLADIGEQDAEAEVERLRAELAEWRLAASAEADLADEVARERDMYRAALTSTSVVIQPVAALREANADLDELIRTERQQHEQTIAEAAALREELAEIKRVTEPPAGAEEMPTDPAELREMWEFVNRQARWQWHMAHKFGSQVERVRALHSRDDDPRRVPDCKGCRIPDVATVLHDRCKTIAALDARPADPEEIRRLAQATTEEGA